MAPDGENFRGINAVRVLSRESKFTLDKIISAGYDRTLTAFEILIPALIRAFEKDIKQGDSLYEKLSGPISVLKLWDYRTGEESVATTLAIEWAQKLNASIQRVYIDEGEPDQVAKTRQYAITASSQQLLEPLSLVIYELKEKWGKWEVAWGDINRFQRLSGDVQSKFDDNQLSMPVPFASALWGMLPSFNSRAFPGTNKRYGFSGNSFVCAVEFGKRIKAKSLLAGGESGHTGSKHFADQIEMYTKGKFKDVLFYKEDVAKNAERTYHPGN
jgi:acyl-homoserine lactone acylase PvdQ